MANEKLFAALAAAGAELKAAKFDATNPHFKNRYASLGSIIDAVRPVFSRHGLAIVQPVDESGYVVTRILHSSGESIEGMTRIMCGDNATAQQYGSALTYARRYGLSSLACIAADDDDDGEAAAHAPAPARPATPPPAPPPARDDAGYEEDGKKKRPASEAQKKRLWAIVKKAGYTEADLKTAARDLFGVESSAGLTWGMVDTLVELAEAGKLAGDPIPFGGDDEPPARRGEETLAERLARLERERGREPGEEG